VYFDGGSETFVSASATGGFTCTSDTVTFAPFVVVECVGDLGPGAGVAVTVNTTVTASGGSTIEATVVADPLDELTQFTTANDFVIEDTNVVDP
jgi:hypothetical protein